MLILEAEVRRWEPRVSGSEAGKRWWPVKKLIPDSYQSIPDARKLFPEPGKLFFAAKVRMFASSGRLWGGYGVFSALYRSSRSDRLKELLANRDLEGGQEGALAFWERELFEVELGGFLQVGESLFDGRPLTDGPHLRALGDVPVSFSVEDRAERPVDHA